MPLSKWDKQHLINLGLTERQIDSIFDTAVKEAAAIGLSLHDFNPDKPFSFADYPQTKARIEKLTKSLQNNVETSIVNGVRSEWTLANNKNSVLADRVFGENKYKLTKAQERRYYNNNDKARDAFIARKTAGLNLSDRVWNYTDQFKSEIEMGMDLCIRNGLSAAEMARDLKQYLKEPDRLFRRVRDEHGQLQLSQNAKTYNPGQGVYRSSYKNAMRLARTENNMAYRTSDHIRWQQLDFVVGIEIRLSNNHTLNGELLEDICDELQGKYPKDFKFTGWHPQCRCHAISILKTPEELARDNERILNGEETDTDSENTVKDVPENFKKWVSDNQDRITRAEQRGTLPYFLKDNMDIFPSRENGYFTTYTTTSARIIATKPLDLSNVNNSLLNIEKQNPEYFNDGYGGVFAAPNGQSYFMSADIKNSKIFVNFGIDENGFNSGNSLVRSFNKINNGILLSKHEEYSIEVLWHEILHLKSKNKTILPPINAVDAGFKRVALETVNQIVARNTYPKFLRNLGGESRHQEWILHNGYGYGNTVNNTRKLLTSLGIDEHKFSVEAEKLLMKDYSNFDKKIVRLMEEMSGKKNIMFVFGKIEMNDFDKSLEIFNKRR